ncbi:MAG TPA: class I SAM-dependent methyltransferase [Casimicrobiaceae bacterium]|nr:class I SAM-dependent methyltransferase [Casimicrobiaceae bacterium]
MAVVAVNARPDAATGYDRIAHLYDVDMARNMPFDDVGFYARTLAQHGGPVLEVGCGNGRILLELQGRGIDIVGVDRSQPMLVELLRKALARSVAPSIARADARRLPFRDGRFQAVLCAYSLITYMRAVDDAAVLIDEIARVLEPGGMLVLDAFVPRATAYSETFRVDYSRPCTSGTLTRSKRIRAAEPGVNRIERRYEIVRDGVAVETIDTVEHIRPFTPDALRALVTGGAFAAAGEAWDYGASSDPSAAQFLTVVARKRR